MCKKTNYHGTSNTQIDKCIRPLVKFLQKAGWHTVASCCGHGKYPVTVICEEMEGSKVFTELFTQTRIPRTRCFYKKDKEGFYFIPEVEKKRREKE